MKDSFGLAEEVFGLIKENVVPYAAAAYFGVTIPELEMDEGDDEGDDDYEDDDEEGDDEPAGVNKKKGGDKKKATGADGEGQNQQECKQN